MTVPREYVEASERFGRFLEDLRDGAFLSTTNQAYTVAQGVLLAFRRRLDVREVALFANALPAVLRAIFVADWVPGPATGSFDDDEAEMTKEVQALRAQHNFAPETSLRDVARALRKHVVEEDFDRVLAALRPGAARFWRA